MSQPQCQNKPAPDLPTQGRHGDARTADPHEGGGQGRQALDRSPDATENVKNQAIRRQALAGISPKWRRLFERGWNGSRKAAIRGHCLECCGFSPQEVRQCGNSTCPLFEFRVKG